ncbi:MAG: hypothetical protein AAF639_28245 [Chloroflexota bacterium]
MSTQTITPEANAEAIARIWKILENNAVQLQETRQLIENNAKEADRRFRQLEGMFGNQWGRLVEAMVEPSAVQVFRDRGIDVRYISRRVEAELDGDHMELDLVLENGDEVVIIETKSSLSSDDVNEFLEDLSQLPRFFPRYDKYKVYGSVAALHMDQSTSRYAYKRGLFVLKITGNNMVKILNDTKFRPRNFSQHK